MCTLQLAETVGAMGAQEQPIALYQEALETSHHLHFEWGMAKCFLALLKLAVLNTEGADVATAGRSEVEGAALVLGATERLLQAQAGRRESLDPEWHNLVLVVQSRLPQDHFDRMFLQGRGMGIDLVVKWVGTLNRKAAC